MLVFDKIMELVKVENPDQPLLISKYTDNGFPAFTSPSIENNELLDLNIGPFSSEQDIKENILKVEQLL